MSIFFRSLTESWIGIWTKWVFNIPTTIPVLPDIAACTAFPASWKQNTESSGVAGALRIVYEGSMYLTVAGILCPEKYSVIAVFKKSPISPSFLFPDASVPLAGT